MYAWEPPSSRISLYILFYIGLEFCFCIERRGAVAIFIIVIVSIYRILLYSALCVTFKQRHYLKYTKWEWNSGCRAALLRVITLRTIIGHISKRNTYIGHIYFNSWHRRE